MTDIGDMLITSKWDQNIEKSISPVQSMEALIKFSIIPKFEKALATFPISTQNHNLILWSLVMSLSELLPAQLLAQTLEQIFFPRWQQVLDDWLKILPNQEDVIAWYSEWESTFPSSVLNLPGIAGPLKHAQGVIKCRMSERPPGASNEDSILFDT